MGFCMQPPILVYEFMGNGSLYQHLDCKVQMVAVCLKLISFNFSISYPRKTNTNLATKVQSVERYHSVLNRLLHS